MTFCERVVWTLCSSLTTCFWHVCLKFKRYPLFLLAAILRLNGKKTLRLEVKGSNANLDWDQVHIQPQEILLTSGKWWYCMATATWNNSTLTCLTNFYGIGNLQTRTKKLTNHEIQCFQISSNVIIIGRGLVLLMRTAILITMLNKIMCLMYITNFETAIYSYFYLF